MAEFRTITDSVPEIIGKTGISIPNTIPYRHISLLVVAYNEEERIGPLLRMLHPFFENTVVCVQASTDRTLEIAGAIANRQTDQVLSDLHWGHGDRSFPLMVFAAKTEWCMVVSCDEWPSQDLLWSLDSAIAFAKLDPATSEAIWVNFRSKIDDLPIEGVDAHLRLFQKRLGWPNTLHSRPMTNRGLLWPIGEVEHDRSLNEMIIDYLSYYEVGRGHPQWDKHNLMMMREAVRFVAKHKGWDYVKSFVWWPKVEELAHP